MRHGTTCAESRLLNVFRGRCTIVKNTTVIAILPESITAKEIHPIDAVIQIHSGIVTVVVTGIRRQSAIQPRLALLFQYDVDNTAHTIGFILCRRISNYLDTFDTVCGKLIQSISPCPATHQCGWFSINEDSHILITTQADRTFQIHLHRRNILHQIACRACRTHQILSDIKYLTIQFGHKSGFSPGYHHLIQHLTFIVNPQYTDINRLITITHSEHFRLCFTITDITTHQIITTRWHIFQMKASGRICHSSRHKFFCCCLVQSYRGKLHRCFIRFTT